MKKVRVGAGSAYWGDMLDPAVELVEKGDINYIGFDHLAELTMAQLTRIKVRDPSRGYIPDIVPWMRAILPTCREKGIKVISNGGGANPEAAGEAVVNLAKELGLTGLKIGVIIGDEITRERLGELIAKGIKFKNLDTGEEDISVISDRIVAANVYIGCDRIIEALEEEADAVIAGRVSDNALYVGPLMHEFGWKFEKPYWGLIGAAVTIGHIIECAECCTGGMSNIWNIAPELWKVGFPIAEVDENGDAVLTKVPGSGGIVNEWTIKEHLVYEIHDPANYLMPDGIADFTKLKVEEIGKDRVKVTNMTGKHRPDTLKMGIGYEDGFIFENTVICPWPNAYEKARKAEEILRERLKMVKLDADELRIDYLGINTMLGSTAAPLPPDYEPNEVGLRVAVKAKKREEAVKVRREITHLWTLAGLGAHMGVPPDPRPVISLWHTLIPREEVPTRCIIREVK